MKLYRCAVTNPIKYRMKLNVPLNEKITLLKRDIDNAFITFWLTCQLCKVNLFCEVCNCCNVTHKINKNYYFILAIFVLSQNPVNKTWFPKWKNVDYSRTYILGARNLVTHHTDTLSTIIV